LSSKSTARHPGERAIDIQHAHLDGAGFTGRPTMPAWPAAAAASPGRPRYPHPRLTGELDLDRRLGRASHTAIGRRIGALGAISIGAKPFADARSACRQRIDLRRTNLGPPRHLGDHRARRQALRHDRPFLFLGPPAPPLGTTDDFNLRRRTVSNISAPSLALLRQTTI
jgi:hypothetical protein